MTACYHDTALLWCYTVLLSRYRTAVMSCCHAVELSCNDIVVICCYMYYFSIIYCTSHDKLLYKRNQFIGKA